MKDDLAKLLIDVCKRVRGGVFMFFPSYRMLNDYYDFWMKKKYSTFIKREIKKDIIIEKNESKVFEGSMDEYQEEIRAMKDGRTTGAVFLAVFRGKLSEGISLNDEFCRCVLVVGIPYGNLEDPRINLK